MVWKIKKLVLVALCIFSIFLLSLPCSAATVYQGTISSTYLNYFKDMCVNIKFDDDYVLYRSSENEYTMVVGDLNYENKVFSGSNCVSYTIKNNSSGYTSTHHSFIKSTSNSFSLSVDDYLVYSNLGGYPDIITEEGYYAKVTLIVVCVIGLCMFIGRIFAFVLRKSR